eukprot:3177216-Pyramimonas_sp.AAC.1
MCHPTGRDPIGGGEHPQPGLAFLGEFFGEFSGRRPRRLCLSTTRKSSTFFWFWKPSRRDSSGFLIYLRPKTMRLRGKCRRIQEIRQRIRKRTVFSFALLNRPPESSQPMHEVTHVSVTYVKTSRHAYFVVLSSCLVHDGDYMQWINPLAPPLASSQDL